jgi:hypothetical protein
MLARADSGRYTVLDHLQIVLRDTHCNQCFETCLFLCDLLYNALTNDIRDTRCPPLRKGSLIVLTDECILC